MMIKKAYYIVVAVVILVLLYWIIKFLPSISADFSKEFHISISESGFSSERRFGFKSTPERKDLLPAFLELNTNFNEKSPLKKTEVKTIKNFHKLEHFFADYEYYYAIKQKLYEILFDELPTLTPEIINLSDSEIEQYFNTHKNSLTESGLDNFKNIVNALRPLKNSSIISYKLEDSYFLMKKQKTLNLRIIFNLGNSNETCLAFVIKMQDDNDLLISPQIKVLGPSLGGMS